MQTRLARAARYPVHFANTALALLAGCALSAAAQAGTLFVDDFTRPDGLVTNEYAYWNPTHGDAKISNDWEMTSGSLFLQNGTGWTGMPDTCSPNATSSNCTNSAVFRLNSKKTFGGTIRVAFAIRQNTDFHDTRCDEHDSCYYGTHIWLRHVSQYNLYYASIERADGKVVIKRKVPCGSDNKGTYFALSSYTPHDWHVGQWKHYSASVETNADNSVTVKLYDDDVSTTVPVVSGTDKGGTNKNWSNTCTTPGKYSSAEYLPITEAGSVGVRGDYANFNIDNFTVTTADQSPSVAITSPANGANVSGIVRIAAQASDDVGVSKVQFYVDNVLKQTDSTAPYAYDWDTAALAGSHQLRALAYDSAGQAGTSSPIQVNVQSSAPPSDTTAPAVRLTQPTAGATLTGTTPIVADASDASGIAKVEFYVDNVLKLSDASSPYTYALLTTELSNGTHTVTAKAYDSAGNSSVTAALPVNISNPSSGTSPGLLVTLKKTSEWDSGYCASIAIKNATNQAITWQVVQDVLGTVTSAWDASWHQTGSKLYLTGASWNRVLGAGKTVTAGFCAKTK